MSELQLFSFKLLVVDDLVIPLFSVIVFQQELLSGHLQSCTQVLDAVLVCVLTMVSSLTFSSFPLHLLFFRSRCKRNWLLNVGLIQDGQCPFASRDPTRPIKFPHTN